MTAIAPEIVLTPEFAEALARLHRGENLFLTGKAGTGKSTLIRTFLAQNDRNALVVAPTGIAALNVDGHTIHRLFSFGPQTTVEHVKSPDYYPGRFAKTLKQLDTLIIDEASMVRADLFDCIAIALSRFGPNPHAPFGGVQIVLVGDLFQLPPVVVDAEQEFFSTAYQSPYFFSAANYEPQEFPAVQLTTVFRQVGDTPFVDLLNQVREGYLLDRARGELNTRVDPSFEPPLDEFWLTLTTRNSAADRRNRQMLDRLPGIPEAFSAREDGDMTGFERPAQDQVSYKTGAQVMMLTNDPAGRWVNGTLGKVGAHTYQDGSPWITIELADGQHVEVGPHTWDVTRPTVTAGRLHHELIGTYVQLPFRLAWAITIHKSQGQTLDRVVVDLTGGAFAYGQLYVALSRCTSLRGLVLTKPVAPRDLQVDQRIRRFLSVAGAESHQATPVYLGICEVGEPGRSWRPRPVELALVTDDGHEVTTLINPSRDLGSARTDYGISASDTRFAPTLVQAWPALAPLLAGRTPVGADIDQLLGHIDYELKRHGVVVSMPLGTNIDPETAHYSHPGIAGATALERARTARELFWQRGMATDSASAFLAAEPLPGYLRPRGNDPVSFVLGGVATPDSSLEQDLVAALAASAAQHQPGPEDLALLREIETLTGQPILPVEGTEGGVDIAAVLVPGAVVCFTGTAQDGRGREIEREDLEDLARDRGLRVEGTVTKSRLTALVVAEAGSLSNKAKAAARYGKPIFTVAQFLAWVNGEDVSPAPGTHAPRAQIITLRSLQNGAR